MQKEKVTGEATGRKARAALAFAAALALVCAVSGCGVRARYSMPPGKSLVYSYSEGRQVEAEDGELSDNVARKRVEIRAMALQPPRNGLTTVRVSAHPPDGDSNVLVGRSFGEADVVIDRSGRHIKTTGSGLPPAMNIDHILPALPLKRMRSRKPWKDVVSVKVYNIDIELELQRKYAGRERVNSIMCDHISSAGKHVYEERIQAPESGRLMDVRLDYEYTEDVWFAKDGYLVKMVVVQDRTRSLKEAAGGDDLVRLRERLETETLLTEIE